MPEKTPGSSDDNLNPVIEQVPHSGVHGYERPVFDFNGQSLQEALERGDLHIEYDGEGKPKVIVPDTISDHADPTQSIRTEAHLPLVTTAEKKDGKRRIAAIAAGAVGTALIGGYTAVKMFGGEDSSKTSDTQLSASAPVSPGQEPGTEPSVSQSPEVIDPTANIEILDAEGTAEEVLGDYSDAISRIINQRVDGGNTNNDNSDLQYMTNTTPGIENPMLDNFYGFVKRSSDNLASAQELYAKNNLGAIDLFIYSNFVVSEPTPDGGFIIESVDEYWAIGEDGQKVGTVLANLDPHRYTFSRGDVLLPDGSMKNTFILTNFETGSADPSQIG